jgi:hypothetical protein
MDLVQTQLSCAKLRVARLVAMGGYKEVPGNDLALSHYETIRLYGGRAQKLVL